MAAVRLVNQITQLSAPVDEDDIARQVKAYLDTTYPDLASLNPDRSPSATLSTNFVPGHRKRPSGGSRSSRPETPTQNKQPKRTLDEDIAHWTAEEDAARRRLEAAESALPGALAAARAALLDIESRAQSLSLERYSLSDAAGALLAELSSDAPRPDSDDSSREGQPSSGPTLLERLEGIQASLARSEAALAWTRVLERVIALRDQTLDPANHTPSALAALPHFRKLCQAVAEAEQSLPPGMALTNSLRSIRDSTWISIKETLSKALLAAAEPLGWPRRVDYPAVPVDKRRAFERAYTELLYLQTEGNRLQLAPPHPPSWITGDGLYPIQALAKPIELRFKYHFQGTRNTNRVDKPEWGFTNIQDSVYEQTNFISDYLQPLTSSAGYKGIDVKSELIMQLCPLLLNFLRARIPPLLNHPALLAHTVYQTVLFDDAVRETGFDLARTSIYTGQEVPEWEGLTGVILREQDWFEQWLNGEKKFAESTLNDIISSPSAWTITDSRDGEDDDETFSQPGTESARQVRYLIEQITDRYAPLPAQEYRVAFLRSIQLPTLAAYHSRISGSLDAFETLSSAFVRAVPGALGARPNNDSRLTSGTAGLERLLKAHVSADYTIAALRLWSDDLLFAEMSHDLSTGAESVSSVWDPSIERYTALHARAEDMMVRLITSEVESDLKPHLTRRWDVGADTPLAKAEPDGPDSSLVSALATFTSLMTSLSSTLPRAAAARVHRRVANHLVNHIAQRSVYAGWSKFTAEGGSVLASEVDDWQHAAESALSSSAGLQANGAKPIPASAPWTKLAEMARVLSLPGAEGQAAGDSPTFAQAMAAAWTGASTLESFRERTQVLELTDEELRAVLRRRIECWR